MEAGLNALQEFTSKMEKEIGPFLGHSSDGGSRKGS